MKKTSLLNSTLSHLVASLGHTDEITIGDAGLPIPEGVKRVDLALTHGIPGFIQTVKTMLTESQVEKVVIANETREISPLLHKELLDVLAKDMSETGKDIEIIYVSHEQFKQQTNNSRAVIRTGECTPYANIIFSTGVTF